MYPGNEAKRAALGMPQALGCLPHRRGRWLGPSRAMCPAKDVQRLLREKPKALGLSVPGMPAVSSPGIDGAIYEGRDAVRCAAGSREMATAPCSRGAAERTAP